MMKFWEKTKDAVAIGINNIQEVTGNTTIEEDADYTKLSNEIKEAAKKLESIQKDSKSFAKGIKAMTESQFALSTRIASLFKDGDNSFHAAMNSLQAQEAIYKYSTYFSDYYLNEYIIKKVKALQDQLEQIAKIEKKRKKNHVLLAEAQKDLEKAKAKGKVKDTVELQEKAAKRQKKYVKHNEDFTKLAKEYLEKAPKEYEEIFNAYQFYIGQFYEESKKQSIDTVPEFKYMDQKGVYPSIVEIPPIQKTEGEEKPQEFAKEAKL